MKTLFIEAKSRENALKLIKDLKLPKNIGVVASIQFLNQLKSVKEYLESHGKKVEVGGQIIGCNVYNATKLSNVDLIIYIGSKNFHPIEIARLAQKPVLIIDPLSNKIGKIEKKDLDEIKKRKKGKILNFLSADKVGIIVTIKPGQENLTGAIMLKKKLKKENYIFVGNEINESDLENFKDIRAWINTACPRIDMNKTVNVSDIASYLK